jgi:hypothetical protein
MRTAADGVVGIGAQAVYTALKETEQRATDLLPLWRLPWVAPLVPRQRKAQEAVQLIRATTERLIAQCKQMVDAEEQVRLLRSRPSSPLHSHHEQWQIVDAWRARGRYLTQRLSASASTQVAKRWQGCFTS